MSKTVKLNDGLVSKHKHCFGDMIPREDGKIFRTQVIGYDDDGNKLFEEENKTVLGGAFTVIEKVFNTPTPFKVETLNQIHGVATGPADEGADNFVCLFGIGTGGCGDTIGSIVDVKYPEREINKMIPFRVVNKPLSDEEKKVYWFKKNLGDTYDAYYLKTFQSITSKCLWDDGVNGEDGSQVSSDVHTLNRLDPINTFVEMTLRIDKKDAREWFNYKGNVETPRVNSIGLFSGVKCTLDNGVEEYKDVRLFSKLNIENEILQLSKGITLVYRIYLV